jgi:hypothetical protein
MPKDTRRGKLDWRSKRASHGRKGTKGKRKGQKKNW